MEKKRQYNTNIKGIIREAIKHRGYTFKLLAEKTGFASTAGVSEAISGKRRLRVDIVASLLDAMDYEIVIRSKLKDDYKEQVVRVWEEEE